MDQRLHPLRPFQKIVKADIALPLWRAGAAKGQEAAKPAPGGAIAGQQGGGEAIAGDNARRRNQPDLRPAIPRNLTRAGMGAHDPGDRVHIRHGQRRHALFGSASAIISSGCEAPVRKVKFDRAESSTKAIFYPRRGTG